MTSSASITMISMAMRRSSLSQVIRKTAIARHASTFISTAPSYRFHTDGFHNHKNNFWRTNSSQQRRTIQSTSNKSNGLFSIPTLHQPNDFVRLAHEAMEECDSLRQTLASLDPSSTPTSLSHAQDILKLLDDVSKTVCNVIDAAELCRSVHSSNAWRQGAKQAFDIISDYIALLNSDTSLYKALTSVTSHPTYFAQLTVEEQRFAILLKEEFERDGIHLPTETRNKIRQLQNHVTQLETLFTENITHSKKYFQVHAQPVEEIIPKHILAMHVPQSDNGPSNEVTLSSDPSIANTILKYSGNGQLRKEVYMEAYTSCSENLQVLEALVQCRHQVATTLGYPSYVDRFLQDKMCGTPQRVQEFLTQLQQRNVKPYQQSMELLQTTKQKIEGVGEGGGTRIEPWDIPFYTSVLKAQRSGNSGGFDSSSVSPYLTIHNCLKAMTTLVSKLFGIQMKEETMTPQERWDLDTSPGDGNGGGVQDPASRIRKFTFHTTATDNQDERTLGTMYLDLHPREGKYSHAAHFTVRCGCALRTKKNGNEGGGSDVDTDYQLPVIALVCNMTSPSSSPVLTHSEVETLFHEFGHALHSLLSRTTFQHLAGTRGAMDFVETPSHLFEQYVWDPTFLTLMAKHYETGEPISTDLIFKLVQSRNDFRCIDVQNQILYAKFDQALFGQSFQDQYYGGSSSSNNKTTVSSTENPTTDLFAKLHTELNIPFAHGTHWHTRFGHLVTYGGGYYGYLYAQVFAADIWKQHFQTNSLNRDAGLHLWNDMLSHGGAQDPNVMLRTLLGREPKVESFLEMMEL